MHVNMSIPSSLCHDLSYLAKQIELEGHLRKTRVTPALALRIALCLTQSELCFWCPPRHATAHMCFLGASCKRPVQGDLVLRHGEYISEHDTFMKLEGVYIVATGRLQAVAMPKNSVQVSLEQQDLDSHTADYRQEPTLQHFTVALQHCCAVAFGSVACRVQSPSLAFMVMLKTISVLLVFVVTCGGKLTSTTQRLTSQHKG